MSLSFKTIFNIFLVISVIVYLYNLIDSIPYSKGIADSSIDALNTPLQTLADSKPIIIKTKQREYKIVPLANYEISGMVVAKNLMFDGEEKNLGPIDLGIIWGKFATKDYDKYVSYRSSQRWLTPHIKNDSVYDWDYIKVHSSHNHLIPANKNVYNAVKGLRNKQKIKLTGYLISVNLDGRNIWSSSLSRDDWGDHSCEVMYVNKVQIDNNLYY